MPLVPVCRGNDRASPATKILAAKARQAREMWGVMKRARRPRSCRCGSVERGREDTEALEDVGYEGR